LPGPVLLVLADDLTGALDSGVQFAEQGISCTVLPLIPLQRDEGETAVTVINTASRHLPSEEAAARVRDCIWLYRDVLCVYKKTDSTLRGHIGAELSSLMKERAIDMLPFIPAYPELGRTTLNGIQYINGTAVAESAMAADPFNPVLHSFIPDIIAEESDIPAEIITKGKNFSGKKGILVFDAGDDEELRNIAAILSKEKLLHDSAGCAGFAEMLAHRLVSSLQLLPREVEKPVPETLLKDLPLLVVSGSLHPLSLSQIKSAMQNGMESGLSGEAILPERIAETLKKKRAFILGTEMSLGIAEKIRDGAAGEETAGILGQTVKKIFPLCGPLLPMVFGGDTLLGIMKELEFTRLTPLAELFPGVVLAEAAGDRGHSTIITKSGAFGEKDLVATVRRLQGQA
jgi:uncharacterized protein YgbK (DUF1537 family)